jgi:histone H3/H4
MVRVKTSGGRPTLAQGSVDAAVRSDVGKYKDTNGKMKDIRVSSAARSKTLELTNSYLRKCGKQLAARLELARRKTIQVADLVAVCAPEDAARVELAAKVDHRKGAASKRSLIPRAAAVRGLMKGELNISADAKLGAALMAEYYAARMGATGSRVAQVSGAKTVQPRHLLACRDL